MLTIFERGGAKDIKEFSKLLRDVKTGVAPFVAKVEGDDDEKVVIRGDHYEDGKVEFYMDGRLIYKTKMPKPNMLLLLRSFRFDPKNKNPQKSLITDKAIIAHAKDEKNK